MQLVGGTKNVDLFIIWGAYFVEVMRSFVMVIIICIFAIKFNEKENRGAIQLFICSSKVSWAVPWKF